jgi:death-on-curing protein
VTSTSLIISPEEIIKVHDNAIKVYGGIPGILDRATLDYLQHRVHNELVKSANKPAPISIPQLAAILLHGIVAKHPFQDGNKRTGILVAESILKFFGHTTELDDDSKISFLKQVAMYKVDRGGVTRWLVEHYKIVSMPSTVTVSFNEKDSRQIVLYSE